MKMYYQIIKTLFFLLFTHSVFSVNCVATIVKDSCWKDFQVDVSIYDSITNSLLTTITVPKDKSWARGLFSCQPNQVFRILGVYSPSIFENENTQVYMKRNITLPSIAPKIGVEWAFNICFGVDFAKLPLPPTSLGNCQCQFDQIPEVVNQE